MSVRLQYSASVALMEDTVASPLPSSNLHRGKKGLSFRALSFHDTKYPLSNTQISWCVYNVSLQLNFLLCLSILIDSNRRSPVRTQLFHKVPKTVTTSSKNLRCSVPRVLYARVLLFSPDQWTRSVAETSTCVTVAQCTPTGLRSSALRQKRVS